MGQSSHCCPGGQGFWPAGRERSSCQAACHSGFEAAEAKKHTELHLTEMNLRNKTVQKTPKLILNSFMSKQNFNSKTKSDHIKKITGTFFFWQFIFSQTCISPEMGWDFVPSAVCKR